MKRRESLQQNIKMKHVQSGSVSLTYGLWFMLFMCIFLCVCIQINMYQSTSSYLEDALAASNLAAMIIDVEEYGISHTVLIDDSKEAFKRYQAAMKGNLNLNDAWECPNKSLISSPVKVEGFTVYNVRESVVDVYEYQENGNCNHWKGQLGSVFAPNGQKVENSGVYSEISCTIKGLFQTEVLAKKNNLADVKRQ